MPKLGALGRYGAFRASLDCAFPIHSLVKSVIGKAIAMFGDHQSGVGEAHPSVITCS